MTKTTARAFETYVEEILLRKDRWKPGTAEEGAIERFQQYCTVLITAPATGKNDVRNLANSSKKGGAHEN